MPRAFEATFIRFLVDQPDVLLSLVPLSTFFLTLGYFAVRQLSRQRYHDVELADRHRLAGLGAWPGEYLSWVTRPLLWLLRVSGLGASAVTLMSLHLAVGAAAAIAANRLTLGGWLFALSGTCDFLDGKLARATNSASPSGAVLDSVVDRYADAIVWIGIAWHFRGNWMLIAVLLAELGSFAVPYVRARAEALSTPMAKVGSFQRPERVAILVFGLIGSPLCDAFWKPPIGWPAAPFLAAAVIVIAVASQLCAFQRLLFAQSALASKDAQSPPHPPEGSYRSVLAASLATCVDITFALWLVNLQIAPAIATVIGCGIGATFNFSVNRIWTFGVPHYRSVAMNRYALVSAFSAFLNGGLVALLLLVPNLPFIVAWIAVRVVIAVTWNYPLHRNYVFVYSATNPVKYPKPPCRLPSVVLGARPKVPHD